MDALDDDRAAARALFEGARTADARAAYLALLARAPDDARVLTDAGTFFFKTGAYAAAQSIFERALGRADGDARAHVNLANVRFARGDFEAARRSYERALELEPQHAEAHQGLSYALVRLDRDEEAAHHRRRGFAGRSVVTGAYRGAASPIDVLLLVAAAGGTAYTDTFLDDTIFRTTTLVADADDPAPPALPRYDVVFNALADADRVPAALAAMDTRFGREATLINAPSRVLATTREENARRLGRLRDVVVPRTVRVARAALERSGPAALTLRGLTFPLLVRSLGFQTGRHFVRVAAPDELAAAVATLPGDPLLAIEFIDARDAQGVIRKYRAMFVDGVVYPMHVAVARDWKIHFFTAEMDNAAYRAEDERFLADPRVALGARAMAALERIRDCLGLDYAGVDFSLDPDGRVIVFEANATMIVLPPSAEPIWDYRRAPVQRVIDAVHTMIRRRASR